MRGPRQHFAGDHEGAAAVFHLLGNSSRILSAELGNREALLLKLLVFGLRLVHLHVGGGVRFRGGVAGFLI